MSKHTPGPWSAVMVRHQPIIKEFGAYLLADAETNNIALISSWMESPSTSEEAEANARLIAAAPDLLEALELVIEEMAPTYHDCTDDGMQECAWCIGRKAIAKARGEA